MHDQIEKYFLEAQMELGRASEEDASWVQWLRESWEELLPSAEFPRHNLEALYDFHGAYNPYDGVVNVAFDALFGIRGSAYKAIDLDFGGLILDNDCRSLFYEFLVEQMRIYLDPGRRMTFRYLANPLRTPMRAARVRLAEAELQSLHPAAEDWLQAQWAQMHAAQVRPATAPAPFWLGAVLAEARTRRDIAGAVLGLRHRTRRFRKRRCEIEAQLFEGNLGSAGTMLTALQGDLNQLTQDGSGLASAAVDTVDMAVRAAFPVPVGPKSAAALVAPVSANWFREHWLRMFRPHLWVVYDLGHQASQVTRVLPVMFERFGLRNADARQPNDFVARIGQFRMPV